QPAKVAVAEGVVRHGGGPLTSLAPPRALVVAEQEHLIPLDRATRAETELIPVERRDAETLSILARVWQFFRERIAGEGLWVAIDLEHRAMKLVSAGLRDVLRHHSGRGPVLGVVCGGR